MEIEWKKLRVDELRDAADLDAMVILPIGAIEQHGPHLPVETDTLSRCHLMAESEASQSNELAILAQSGLCR